MFSATDVPADFVWGVATSAYQIEGAHDVDGRGPSIWDTFCRRPGAVHNGDTGDVACDHYHRYKEDLDLLVELGVDAYRFSIAWPRVIPNGTGEVNAKGLAFYDELVDGLLERGITPYVTLYHWDLPQALQDQGGWPSRDTAEAFAEYAAVVVRSLGDRVQSWATLNEPQCSAWHGHLEGVMAPGVKDLGAAVRASVHLHLAHGLGVQAIRANATLAPQVGIVNNHGPVLPASDRPEDVAAARRADGHGNRWWLDPLHGKGYPQDMVELYGVDLPLRPGDLETIAQPLDFLGVNYYTIATVRDAPEHPHVTRAEPVPAPDRPHTAMGWEVDADGLEVMLRRIADDYQPRAIYVTENGSAWDDEAVADGYVEDVERTSYLESHIEATLAAACTAPVKGYFAWSMLDNFEWAYGYDKRFGLVRVDYETQKRTVKASGRWYAGAVRGARQGSAAAGGAAD
ncbi:MAG: GH1 family beta-glucosidase [Motilibacteraceae bacterium]